MRLQMHKYYSVGLKIKNYNYTILLLVELSS